MTKQQARRKHVPMRSCVICRSAQPKRSLIRVVSFEQRLVIDPSGKLAGRGAYLCHSVACWQRALASSELLSRALRIALSAEDKAALQTFLEQELGQSSLACN